MFIVILLNNMPAITLRKAIYDELLRQQEDPTEFANKAAAEKLLEIHGVELSVELEPEVQP